MIREHNAPSADDEIPPFNEVIKVLSYLHRRQGQFLPLKSLLHNLVETLIGETSLIS